MAAVPVRVNDDQRAVLEMIYRAFLESGDWPRYGWLDDKLDGAGVDLNATLETMPEGLYWPDWRPGGTVWYAEDAQLGLRVAGLALCRGSEEHLEMLLAIVKWLVKMREPKGERSPQTVESVEARTADLIEPLRTVVGHDPLARDLKLMLELMHVEPGLPSWSGSPDDVIMRTFAIERSVRRRFRTVKTVPELLDALRPAPRAPLAAVPDVLELEANVESPATMSTAPVTSTPVPAPEDGVAASRAPKRKRKYWHKHSERFGRWTLKSQLGYGGNAEVWRARDEETFEVVALKILHADDTDAEAYARFRREVEVVRELADEGARVLPIVDHSLPEDLHVGVAAWYAMPEASAIRDHLVRAPMVVRVAALAEIAAELAHLGERGWYHRDLKPANLYFYKGRFVVGDFGLIKRPDDEELTRPDKTPGPYEYMPNEAVMRDEPIDPAAFDLQCLAKSLWVVLTDSRRPPQGRIPAGSYRSLSRKFNDEPRVDVLDEIIAAATSDDPEERGTMSTFAAALADWVSGRAPSRAAAAAAQAPVAAPAAVDSPSEPRELERAVIILLQDRDDVGLRELLRDERLRLEERVRTGVAEKYGSATYGDVAEFWRGVEPVFERVLATTLPLIRHSSPHWDEQLRWFARFADVNVLESGLVVWIEMSRWCGWLFANTCGAYATREENLAVVSSLLTPAGPTLADGDLPLGLIWPGESGNAVGSGMMAELDKRNYFVPCHEYTLRYLSEMPWLSERYGEFAATRQTLEKAFDDFNFLATLAAAKAERQLIATWTMRSTGATELARRIRTSSSLRARVAEAVGATAEELASDGNDLLIKAAAKPAGYNRSDASLS